MNRKTLTDRVKELEEKINRVFLSEKQQSCIQYISIFIDSECKEHAIKQLAESNNWISVIDSKKINQDYKNPPIIMRDNKMCILTPSGKIKYDRHYFKKLEEIVFGKDENNTQNFIKKFLNRIKKK